MTLFDLVALAVALVISYFGGIALLITLMVALAVMIVVRLMKGERMP